MSDSWNKANTKVGEILKPPEDWPLAIRRFSESAFLREKRKEVWTKHQLRDRNSRKRSQFGTAEDLREWTASTSAPSGSIVRSRPASQESLAAATSKASAPAPGHESEDEPEDTSLLQSLWQDLLPR